MLDLDALRAYGANVDEGLTRCMNNEGFYLRMVGMALDDPGVGELRRAIEAQEWQTAFEKAHALKGVLANLALTPVAEPVAALTERLRGGAAGDYTAAIEDITARWEQLQALRG